MRRVVLAVGVLCAVGVTTGRAAAQNSASGGTTMPGTAVGSYRGQVAPVGQQAPAAAPQAGQSITGNSLQRAYDPTRPYDSFKGTGLDPKNVLAPVTGPDGKPVGAPDALDELSDRIRAFFGVNQSAPPRPPYAPGVIRRGKERNDHMWRRD